MNPIEGENPGEFEEFLPAGVNGLNSGAYLQGHGGDWPTEPECYNDWQEWLYDQGKFLFDRNINLLGCWQTFIEEPDEDMWFNTLASYSYQPYIDYGCDCDEEADDEDYANGAYAGNARLADFVNVKLNSLFHDSDPEDFPHPYFPFVMYLYPVRPYAGDALSEDMIPDIWSKAFKNRLYLKCFLAISDGLEPEDECDGKWIYSTSISEPMVEDINGEVTLMLPGFFQCHRPAGIGRHQALVSYALSDDVQWSWIIREDGSPACHRPWIRRILCQDFQQGATSTPAGRRRFAEVMKEYYEDKFPGVEVSKWNEYHPDYEINRFLNEDQGEPGWPDESLERIDNIGCPECFETPYPGGFGENDSETINTFLTGTTTDLGFTLRDPEAEGFTVAMAADYYPMVIDAVRFFDGCHMISSANFNWIGRANGDWPGASQFHNFFCEMANATGNFFTEEKNCISYINTQFYPTLPEEPPAGVWEGYKSIHSLYCDMKDAYLYMLDNADRALPFFVASYTSHADWDRQWDYYFKLHSDTRKVCPKVENPDPGREETWFDCAPYPHGDMDKCKDNPLWAGTGRNTCINPDPNKLQYTETGLLKRDEDPYGGDRNVDGRGNDYWAYTSAPFFGVNVDERLHHFIIGYSWHSYYDSGFEKGDESEKTNNWGVVNPQCATSGTGDDFTQYTEFHQDVKDMNGYLQFELGGGETWSGDQAPDPSPPLTDPFEGCE